MLFNSIEFLVFLPIVALIYFWLPFQPRRVFLLFASYVFYGFFSVPLTLLLVWSTLLDFTTARIIDTSDSRWKKRLAFSASLVGNLSILISFKYLDFFSYSLASILGFEPWPMLNVILPMGISFYTFQTMSYTIDVYRGNAKASNSILDVALYVSFFPQLVAGPIMRGSSLLPQFREDHKPNLDRIASGALLCCWGLLKKVYIADPMGQIVNSVYGTSDQVIAVEQFSGLACAVATYAFAIQIYCDFSAYSDIAIGSARILGIRLMKNFDAPYLSCSIQDFWRRWHISLSTWLRDYLYIPLGGNRGSKIRTYVNLLITMLLGGLWHGASWTFVVWGALHGLLLSVERMMGGLRDREPTLAWKVVRGIVTFHLVCLAWIFFRASTMDQAYRIIYQIGTFTSGEAITLAPVACLVALLCTQQLKRKVNFGEWITKIEFGPRWAVYASLALILLAVSGSTSSDFIYFQF